MLVVIVTEQRLTPQRAEKLLEAQARAFTVGFPFCPALEVPDLPPAAYAAYIVSWAAVADAVLILQDENNAALAAVVDYVKKNLAAEIKVRYAPI